MILFLEALLCWLTVIDHAVKKLDTTAAPPMPRELPPNDIRPQLRAEAAARAEVERQSANAELWAMVQEAQQDEIIQSGIYEAQP